MIHLFKWFVLIISKKNEDERKRIYRKGWRKFYVSFISEYHIKLRTSGAFLSQLPQTRRCFWNNFSLRDRLASLFLLLLFNSCCLSSRSFSDVTQEKLGLCFQGCVGSSYAPLITAALLLFLTVKQVNTKVVDVLNCMHLDSITVDFVSRIIP